MITFPALLSSQFIPAVQLVRQEGATNDLAQLILESAYERLGIPVQIKIAPAGRALEEVVQSRADGDVARIDGLELRYPNLIKIPVVILQTEGHAFSLAPLGPLNSWKDLSKFRLAFRRGLQFAEVGTQGLKVERTTTEEQAFRMLEMKRVDVVIAGYLDGWQTARILSLTKVQSIPLPMEKISLFHYLHEDRQDVVAGITGILKKMEAEGELQRMRNAFISKTN